MLFLSSLTQGTDMTWPLLFGEEAAASGAPVGGDWTAPASKDAPEYERASRRDISCSRRSDLRAG